MRILFTTLAPPSPPMHGQRLRNRAILQALKAEGHEITLLTLDDGSATNIESLHSLTREIRLLRAPIAARRGWADYMARAATLVSPRPHGAMKYRSPQLTAAISEAVDDGKYDLAICDDIYLIQNFPPRLPVPLVLNKHDFVHVILSQYLAWQRNPAVQAYGRIECMKLRHYESWACGAADSVIVCSESDAKLAARLSPGARISVVPNAIDVDSYSPQPEYDQRTLLFCGSMAWHPNRDAMQYFVAQVLPRILSRASKVRLRITGERPSEDFVRRLDPSGMVDFTGWLPDIRPEIARSTISIVPLRIGSGTRLKIMEAAAMARPVVSTSIGAEGLAFADGEEILLADGAEAFADAVVSLLEDAPRRRALGSAARRRVAAAYGIDALRAACCRTLLSVCAASASCEPARAEA